MYSEISRCAFASYAVACFKLSHSIRASARSRLSRDSSASSSATSRRHYPSVVSWPCRARPTQRLSVLPDMARRRVASGIITCCSRTNRTACSRNSFVYCCHGTCSILHPQPSHYRLRASTFSSLPHCPPNLTWGSSEKQISEWNRELIRPSLVLLCHEWRLTFCLPQHGHWPRREIN